MSLSDRPSSPLPEGTWGRVLPWLALFARCAIGLCVLNIGLAFVLAIGVSNASPPPDPVGMLIWGMLQTIPYFAIAVGLGLVFGVFTLINALLACGISLVIPATVLVSLLAQSSFGPGTPFGRNPYSPLGPDFVAGALAVSYPILVLPSLVILVLLSPREINRFSLDTLMFARPRAIARRGAESETVLVEEKGGDGEGS